jgi:hypothetical protein
MEPAVLAAAGYPWQYARLDEAAQWVVGRDRKA